MAGTLVIQSYRSQTEPAWIAACLESVRAWAAGQGWDYRFFGDEILDRVPDWYREGAQGRWPVMTDLARLLLARDALAEGRGRVLWVDADVLVFVKDGPDLSTAGEDYAFARELWVQPDGDGIRVYRNVHNAVCWFGPGNPVLDFYIHACERIVGRLQGGAPNQIVGPKLLTALHNMLGFPLMEDVGMASPLVARDIAAGGGPALRRLIDESRAPLRAMNLCASLVGREVDGVRMDAALMQAAVARLRDDGETLFS